VPQNKISTDNRNGKTYTAICFTTMQLPCFNIYRELFYPFNVKIVPYNIYEMLTPRGLAYWIMDDGSKQNNGLHLSVYAFKNEDVDKLMFTLPFRPGLAGLGRREDKFNLKCSIHYNRDNKPRIYIFKQSMENLITMVKPYFLFFFFSFFIFL